MKINWKIKTSERNLADRTIGGCRRGTTSDIINLRRNTPPARGAYTAGFYYTRLWPSVKRKTHVTRNPAYTRMYIDTGIRRRLCRSVLTESSRFVCRGRRPSAEPSGHEGRLRRSEIYCRRQSVLFSSIVANAATAPPLNVGDIDVRGGQ